MTTDSYLTCSTQPISTPDTTQSNSRYTPTRQQRDQLSSTYQRTRGYRHSGVQIAAMSWKLTKSMYTAIMSLLALEVSVHWYQRQPLTPCRAEGDSSRPSRQHLLPLLLPVYHRPRCSSQIALGIDIEYNYRHDHTRATCEQQWCRPTEHRRVGADGLSARGIGKTWYLDPDATRRPRLQSPARR